MTEEKLAPPAGEGYGLSQWTKTMRALIVNSLRQYRGFEEDTFWWCPPIDVPDQRTVKSENQYDKFPFDELLGATKGLRLNLHRSDRFEGFTRHDAAYGSIIHCYDIDSLILFVTTLAVHVDGMVFNFRPSFFSTVQENPHNGLNLHQCKNIELGWGPASLGYGIRMYIFFEDLIVEKTNALSDDEMSFWTNRILLPALAETCRWTTKQRLYANWECIRHRSNVKSEIHLDPGDHDAPIGLRRPAPESRLEAIWQAIRKRCNQIEFRGYNERHPNAPSCPFRKPKLYLIGHDIKEFTRTDHKTNIHQVANQLLSRIFRFRPEYFPPQQLWMDWALEMVPEKDGIHHDMEDRLSSRNSKTFRG